MKLALHEHPDGVETEAGTRVVYDLERNEAHVGAARVDGPALVWEVTAHPGAGDWVLRCDRVDFPPGGIAHRHVHPGPGLRRLLQGELTIDRDGERHTYRAGEWWYEDGDDPVLATASASEDTAFVRVLLLPREWEGKRTIRVVSAT